MTEQEIEKWKAEIDKMSQAEMARLWRFAPVGHPLFNSKNKEIVEYFNSKYKGMTPKISKQIGWEK